MVEVLKKEYWSKSEAFLLPLTELNRNLKYDLKTYLFWDNYSIEDYYLTLKFTYDNYQEFLDYSKKLIFPILDKNGYLSETFDFKNETVLILNLSEWAMDIEMFLKGKYSKMSKLAKSLISKYHTFYDHGHKILIEISASLDPNARYLILDNMTAIEYVAENYGLDLEELKKIGELGGIYNKEKETLTVKYDYS